MQKTTDKVISGIEGAKTDSKGRFIEAQFGNLSVISLYLHQAHLGQAFKFKFMNKFTPYLQECSQNGRDHIICDDWNIAHKEIDLKNWRENRKSSGFLPEERAWLDQLFADEQWINAFRLINRETDQYTWRAKKRRLAY